LTPAKRALGLYSVGTLILLSAGGFLVARGSSSYGWWLVALGLANASVPAIMLARERRQATADAAVGAKDVHRLAYREGQMVSMFGGTGRDATVRRWVSVAHVPSKMGYVLVTWPLGVLEVSPGRIGLRVRLAITRAVFGIETLDAHVGEGIVVYPAHRPALGGYGSGIEIRLPGRPSFYFWTEKRAEVLAAIAAVGFEVSDQEQKLKLHLPATSSASAIMKVWAPGFAKHWFLNRTGVPLGAGRSSG